MGTRSIGCSRGITGVNGKTISLGKRFNCGDIMITSAVMPYIRLFWLFISFIHFVRFLFKSILRSWAVA